MRIRQGCTTQPSGTAGAVATQPGSHVAPRLTPGSIREQLIRAVAHQAVSEATRHRQMKRVLSGPRRWLGGRCDRGRWGVDLRGLPRQARVAEALSTYRGLAVRPLRALRPALKCSPGGTRRRDHERRVATAGAAPEVGSQVGLCSRHSAGAGRSRGRLLVATIVLLASGVVASVAAAGQEPPSCGGGVDVIGVDVRWMERRFRLGAKS
jgi:hypothetical protein